MYGDFVKRVRESRVLSQRELADISGVSQPNISAIENDRRVPSADTLNRILVSCGYELAAVAGERIIYAPLPTGGWFPDEGLPPRLPDDPPDEPPIVTKDTPSEERARVVDVLLSSIELG